MTDMNRLLLAASLLIFASVLQSCSAESTTGEYLQDSIAEDLLDVQGAPLACPAAQEYCDGLCVSLESDLEHCGSCGNPCALGLFCIGGECLVQCPEGQEELEGRCLLTCPEGQEPRDGECRLVCPEGEHEENGVCVEDPTLPGECPEGSKVCDGSCTDIMSDEQHCGDCNVPCFGGRACLEGNCLCPVGTGPLGDQCTAGAGKLSVYPEEIDFGARLPGFVSMETLKLYSTVGGVGGAEITGIRIIEGEEMFEVDFEKSNLAPPTKAAPLAMPSGTSLTISLKFAPKTTSQKDANGEYIKEKGILYIESNSDTEPMLISLWGIGWES